jgi:hypothetical protein
MSHPLSVAALVMDGVSVQGKDKERMDKSEPRAPEDADHVDEILTWYIPHASRGLQRTTLINMGSRGIFEKVRKVAV